MAIANRLLRIAIGLVAVLTSGVVAFVFDVTLGLVPGLVAGAALLVLLGLLLLAFPARVLSRLRRPPA